MGIDGLLILLKELMQKQHISAFRGKTLGIDALPWLYKGCYSHVIQMDENDLTAEKQPSCSVYLLMMLNLLQEYQIKPIFVFDGRPLVMKNDTIAKRSAVREQNMKKAGEFINKQNIKEGRKFTARSIRVEESVIVQAMCILRTKKIDFLVAPYQSDSQLAKLKKLGLIDAVITQDSDLLVYGCNVIYKLDEEGVCDYIDLNHKRNQQIKCKYVKSFLQLDQQSRTIVCVLAGCDYVPSIKGIGLKKAIRLVQNEPNILKLMQNLRNDKVYNERVPAKYEQKVLNAITIFKHALVFNPITNQMENLDDFPEGIYLQTCKIVGEPYIQYLNLEIFKGSANPRNLKPRFITQIQIINTENTENTKLLWIKRNNSMSQQSKQESEMNEEYENNMMEAMKNIETAVEQPLWPFHQYILNQCITSIFPF